MDNPKFNNAEIQRECKVISEKIQSMHDRVSEMVVGRKARILSNFNGQACGRSKPSLKGKIITVKNVSIDSYGCQLWDGNYDHCFIPMDEVEFLDSENAADPK